MILQILICSWIYFMYGNKIIIIVVIIIIKLLLTIFFHFDRISERFIIQDALRDLVPFVTI